MQIGLDGIAVLIAGLVVAVFAIIFAILLIFGITKGYSGAVVPMLVWIVIEIVLYCLSILHVLVMNTDHIENGDAVKATYTVIAIMMVILKIYFFVVLRACQQQIRWENSVYFRDDNDMVQLPSHELLPEDSE
jgi:hypothetical protein